MFSIIIQGPINERSLSHVEQYQCYGEVIIATWSNDPLLSKVLEKYPGMVVHRDEPQRLYYGTCNHQFFGVYHGLLAAKHKYTIRTRSDEFFNLDPLIETFLSGDTSRTFVGNIFFKRWAVCPFHIGDHLIVGRSSILLQAYKNLIEDPARYTSSNRFAEQFLSCALLDVYREEWTKEAFMRHVDVIDINRLKPFIARWNGANRDYDNHFDEFDCITCMEEL